jgi:hypothetical protein
MQKESPAARQTDDLKTVASHPILATTCGFDEGVSNPPAGAGLVYLADLHAPSSRLII